MIITCPFCTVSTGGLHECNCPSGPKAQIGLADQDSTVRIVADLQFKLSEAQASTEEWKKRAELAKLVGHKAIKELSRYKTAFANLEDLDWFGSKTSRQSLDIIREEMTRIIQGDGRRE